MAHETMLGTKIRQLVLLVAVAVIAAPSSAAEFNLRAGTGTLTMPDGTVVPMWGFACESSVPAGLCANPGVVTVPGPMLAVPAGDSTLVVNLTNDLAVPVSIVIPGQATTMTPVWMDGTSGPRSSPGQRVRSFTQETPAAGGPVQYVWNDLRPGTYLYHSGTHPQVQVQMGLYGAVTKPAGTGLAYGGVGFDLEHVLLFSEIDPALHDAVAGPSPSYGTPGYPSTLDYRPRYFLVNGAPFTPASGCLDGLTAGNRILLRMLNAGLRELAPMILQSHWNVVAEGGSPYSITAGGVSVPHGKEQYSLLLPPGGTADAVFIPQAGGEYRIIDRRLNLTNATIPDGGFQTCITVAALAGQPIANANGPYSGTAGTAIAFSSSGSDPNVGTIVSYGWEFGDGGTSTDANPLHLYAAPGMYAVSLTVTDSEGLRSTPDYTTATVAPANGAPTADANGPYAGKVGFPVAFSGAGSSDPEGDVLTYRWSFGDSGLGSGVAPSHTYAAVNDFTVTLTVNDGHANSAPSATTAHVTVNSQPVANAGGPYNPAGLSVTFDGSGSYDPDNQDADPNNDDALSYAWSFGDGTTGTGPAPVHAYAVPGVYTVTLSVNDGYVTSAAATTTATITTPPAQNKHVGDLDWTSANIGGNRWRATVTVRVHDTVHNPLAGVTVNGGWSGGDGNGRTTSCTTGVDGQCSLTSGRLSRIADANVIFTVTSLTGAGATYLATANHDPDASPQSSNGTSITVPRP
jgi:PKD repeat protein